MLSRGLPGEPRSLDPATADDTFSLQVLRDLWEGVTNIDGSGHVVPGVASDWTVDPSGLVYEFHIRPDAKWSDGAPVLADQFVEGLRHAVDPSTGSGSADILSVVKNAASIAAGKSAVAALGVTAVGARTLRIEVERPAPFILQILAEPIAAPRRPELSKSSPSQVTNGPYIVKERRLGAYVALAANSNYWNEANVRLKAIKYVITESESSELLQFRAKQLDLTYTVPLADLPKLREERSQELQTAPILGTMYLALNLSNKELAASKALREALTIAIDRESITKNLTLGASPAFGFVARGTLNYERFVYPWASLGPDAKLSLARKSYADAGYSATHPLKIVLYFNNNESIKRIMVAIADSWRRNLGVETTLLGEEFRVFLDGRKDKSKWDAARLGWLADYNDPSSFLEILTTSGIQNDPGYSDAEYDAQIAAARADPNEQHRAHTLSEAEARLLLDYPIIPVYFYSASHLVSTSVDGATISPLNRTYSRLLSWR